VGRFHVRQLRKTNQKFLSGKTGVVNAPEPGATRLAQFANLNPFVQRFTRDAIFDSLRGHRRARPDACVAHLIDTAARADLLLQL
jgi:hypothetical protein